MSVKLSSTGRAIVAGVASAGLLIGAFALGVGQAGGSTAAPAGASSPASLTTTAAPVSGAGRITVTGTGTVTGTPDQLLLSMGVQTSGASVSAALQAANNAVRAVTRALTRSGVARADIQTSGLSIQPQYNGQSPPTGYGVSEFIQVTLRHLASAGTQIAAAVHAGGNATVVDGVSLNLSDTSSLMAAARTRAVADAKAKAAQYARALGQPLGPLVSLSESAPSPLPLYGYLVPSAAAGAKSSTVPVHPGTEQLSVTVTATFSLA